MRLAAAVILAVGVALTGCVSVEPDDAAERALAGATLGSGLGAGLGATLAINPLLGAYIGAESGAALGAAAGVMTAQPAPTYKPIPVPANAVIPGFYDTWPPGSHAPAPGTSAAPPRAG